MAAEQQLPGGGFQDIRVLAEHLINALSQGLALAPAVDALGGLVPIGNTAIQIEHHDGVAGFIQQGGLSGQIGEEVAALGDIAHTAHHTQGVAVFIADYVAAIRHIGHAAVLAYEAVLRFPFLLLAVNDPFNIGEHALFVVRMNARGPGTAVPFQVFGTVAEQGFHAFAPPQPVSGRVPVPDRIGGGAGGGLKADFFFA